MHVPSGWNIGVLREIHKVSSRAVFCAEDYTGRSGPRTHACPALPLFSFLGGSASTFAVWLMFLLPTLLPAACHKACLYSDTANTDMTRGLFTEAPYFLGGARKMSISPARCTWISTPPTRVSLIKAGIVLLLFPRNRQQVFKVKFLISFGRVIIFLLWWAGFIEDES